MNYARFKDVMREFGSAMAELGIPNEAIDDIYMYAERTAIPAEINARHDRQFIMEFKREGVASIADRYGKSTQAMRKKFNLAVNRNAVHQVVFEVA